MELWRTLHSWNVGIPRASRPPTSDDLPVGAQQPVYQPVFQQNPTRSFYLDELSSLCVLIPCLSQMLGCEGVFNAMFPRVSHGMTCFCGEESILTLTDNTHYGHTSGMKLLQIILCDFSVRWGPSPRKEETLTVTSWTKPHCKVGGQWYKKLLLISCRWGRIQNFKNITLIKVMIQDI